MYGIMIASMQHTPFCTREVSPLIEQTLAEHALYGLDKTILITFSLTNAAKSETLEFFTNRPKRASDFHFSESE